MCSGQIKPQELKQYLVKVSGDLKMGNRMEKQFYSMFFCTEHVLSYLISSHGVTDINQKYIEWFYNM
jgi:hypothetical protein